MTSPPNRREFLAATAVAPLAAANRELPKFGIVAHAEDEGGPAGALKKVARLGFPTCQLFIGEFKPDYGAQIRSAVDAYKVEITALMTLGAGRMAWDLKNGPLTVGIVPRETRSQRVAALKRCSDLAKECGVPAIHTHLGFIPENPNDPLYAEILPVIRDVVRHASSNGQTFLCETGQETPITLLRAIHDVGFDNMKVNLDMANLILYGRGDAMGALDVLGEQVRGTHAKDGLYPTDPYGLGEEVAIGKGKVPFPAVMKRLAALRYTGPITIEREINGPQQEADIRAAHEYLASLVREAY